MTSPTRTSAYDQYAEEYAALQGGISTDWIDLISRPGAQMSNQLSLTGGNDRTQYSLSGNLVRDDGVVLGITVMGTLFVVVMNIIADILYPVLDPRVQLA